MIERLLFINWFERRSIQIYLKTHFAHNSLPSLSRTTVLPLSRLILTIPYHWRGLREYRSRIGWTCAWHYYWYFRCAWEGIRRCSGHLGKQHFDYWVTCSQLTNADDIMPGSLSRVNTLAYYIIAFSNIYRLFHASPPGRRRYPLLMPACAKVNTAIMPYLATYSPHFPPRSQALMI